MLGRIAQLLALAQVDRPAVPRKVNAHVPMSGLLQAVNKGRNLR